MINTWAFKLADIHLASLPDILITEMCPQDYGDVVTDDHRNLVWDVLVDYYKAQSPVDLYKLYTQHVLEDRNIPASTHEAVLGRLDGIKKMALNIARHLDRMMDEDKAPWEE